jgi:hypothetical protein
LEGDRIGLTSRAFQAGEIAHTIAHEAAQLHGWPDYRTRNFDGTYTQSPLGWTIITVTRLFEVLA